LTKKNQNALYYGKERIITWKTILADDVLFTMQAGFFFSPNVRLHYGGLGPRWLSAYKDISSPTDDIRCKGRLKTSAWENSVLYQADVLTAPYVGYMRKFIYIAFFLLVPRSVRPKFLSPKQAKYKGRF
jgi:hypothetical protein